MTDAIFNLRSRLQQATLWRSRDCRAVSQDIASLTQLPLASILRHYVHILSVTVIVCNILFHLWAPAWVFSVKILQLKKSLKLSGSNGCRRSSVEAFVTGGGAMSEEKTLPARWREARHRGNRGETGADVRSEIVTFFLVAQFDSHFQSGAP